MSGLTRLLWVLLVLATIGGLPLASSPPANAETGADKVFVGAFIKDVQDIDLASESFTVDFYLWLRWTNPKINPAATIEAMNSNGFQNTTTSSTGGVAAKPLFDAPVDLPDGSKYMLLRYQGVFSRKLMLQNYPFDTQVLRVVFKDERADARKLEYVADKKPISISRSLLLSIPGFSLGTPTLQIVSHQYETDFGDTSAPADVPYSCIRIELPVTRDALPYLVKIVLPILIVIFVTSLIYALPARLEEARAGIGVTALLTIVALQWSADSSLPSVEYLTMLDVIYILSMVYIAAAIGYTVLASRRNKHEIAQALTAAVDRRVGIISLVVYGTLIGLTVYLHLSPAHPGIEFLM
jgi:hypothetical protein